MQRIGENQREKGEEKKFDREKGGEKINSGVS